ncbi:alpha-soluble NSF attachment protein [Tremella mesenterica]|uniref:Alpha-soluble NSF attachment protein n=1 Tax=Tremella mesenterica TaxID=5217 RepID=A0A4Q1BTX7_TREME|nr:alpha-soluble NSF attachment protein [Tremella mesenterica]
MGKSPGDEILAKAEKKATSSPGWFGSSSQKWEEAGDLFAQAANSYKVEGRWSDSGAAFEREAACRNKAGESNDEINAWHNAAKSYKKSNPEVPPGTLFSSPPHSFTEETDDLDALMGHLTYFQAAVTALHQCIKLLVKSGNFRQAADREKEIAGIYAQDGLDIAKARDSFVQAGDWYKQEDANATANQCYQQAAELSADLQDFKRSMELYQTVADWSLTSALTKYSVKEYWLRACMCSMAMGDLVLCQRLLETFSTKDVTFPSTREAKFAHELMDACEQGDVERYTAAVYQYDQVTKLDNWKTAILLKIKKALEEDEGGLT